jgi:aryl-alcohol dehydrogenase-like predicted oxidoreductase
MELRALRNGMSVSAIALGAWELGGGGAGATADQAVADEIVSLALDAGINLFDTAPGYGNGRSERMLGLALRARRADALVATKFRNLERWDKQEILDGLRASLDRLAMERVDLFQMHWPTKAMTAADAGVMTDAFGEAMARGWTRAVGVSNFRLHHLRLLPKAALAMIVTNQMSYSLLTRECENDGVAAFCAGHGVALLAYSPLESGLLSGAYRLDTPPVGVLAAGSRWLAPEDYPRAMRVVDVLRDVSALCRRTPAQVALRWLMDRSGVAAVIVGTTKAANLRNNLGALGWRPEAEYVARLDATEAESALAGA